MAIDEGDFTIYLLMSSLNGLSDDGGWCFSRPAKSRVDGASRFLRQALIVFPLSFEHDPSLVEP